MHEGAHYRFPPAAAYPLNRCLKALKSDRAFAERFVQDPRGAAREHGLAEDEARLLDPLDRDALVARGAHPYLVFMAGLRLKMLREPGTMEHF